MPLVELVAAHPDLGETAVELLEPGVAVTRRRTPGGAGPGPVAEQAERFVRRREVDRTAAGPMASDRAFVLTGVTVLLRGGVDRPNRGSGPCPRMAVGAALGRAGSAVARRIPMSAVTPGERTIKIWREWL